MKDEPFQAAFAALVLKAGSGNDPTFGGIYEIDPDTSVFTWYRTMLPYIVPPCKELHITDAHFASKHVVHPGDERSSYMAIQNVFTLTESNPTFSLQRSFIVPASCPISVMFMNNSPEDQWMNGFLLGFLRTVRKPKGARTRVTVQHDDAFYGK